MHNLGIPFCSGAVLCVHYRVCVSQFLVICSIPTLALLLLGLPMLGKVEQPVLRC